MTSFRMLKCSEQFPKLVFPGVYDKIRILSHLKTCGSSGYSMSMKYIPPYNPVLCGKTVVVSIEPSRGKTNNVVSNQVGHKPCCTNTEAG